jgi:hypothetical protein
LKEIINAANGLTVQSNEKPDHVIEGENAKAYVNHVMAKSSELTVAHKQMQDELERQK